MRTAHELEAQRPQHERWVVLSVEAGQMTPHRCLRDLRVLRERATVLGERCPTREALAARWGCSLHMARGVITTDTQEAAQRKVEGEQEARIGRALVERRRRSEAQRIEREARAAQAAEQARAKQGERDAEARRRSLDRHHDAWLSAARSEGPLSDHEALVDLGVLRWRRSVPGPTALGARWAWKPRAEVVPFLNRHPTSAAPDFAHLEVAHG
jgi:hypothetical protein